MAKLWKGGTGVKSKQKKENNQLKSCHNTGIKQEFVVLHYNIVFMHISGSNHHTCITNGLQHFFTLWGSGIEIPGAVKFI